MKGGPVSDDDRCRFGTQRPVGAMSQPARHSRSAAGRSRTRYERCRNKGTRTVWIEQVPVRCCALHERLHNERGWMP